MTLKRMRSVAKVPSGSMWPAKKCWAASAGTYGASQPSAFQASACAASVVLTRSTLKMREAYSCAMREKMRSAPERSTRTEIPGNFPSKILEYCSAVAISMAV